MWYSLRFPARSPAHQSGAQAVELPAHGAVIDRAADARQNTADEAGIERKIHPYLLSGPGAECAFHLPLFRLVERTRRGDLGQRNSHSLVEQRPESRRDLAQQIHSSML